MIEIKTNIKGVITARETEEQKGIGTYWTFNDLQDYVEENHKLIDKESLYHLCMLSMSQMNRYLYTLYGFELKDAEKFRLCSDLEMVIKRLYYNDEERDYDVKINDPWIEFYKDRNLLERVTLARFEEDLEVEPDVKENSLQFINFLLETEYLNNVEKEKLADKLVKIYQDIKQARAEEEAQEKIRKLNKKK